MESQTQAPDRRRRRNSRWGERFAYGGVAFEVLADGHFELGDEHLSFCAPVSDPACQIELRVAVTADPSLSPTVQERDVVWQWDSDVATVRTGRVDAELLRLGPRRYAARARLLPSVASGSSLVSALSCAIVNREGGLVLHAAGVVLDDHGFLFIGPSGAGKTTAANHCEAARWIARDRAAVLPTCDGWVVWGMAGGDEIHLSQAPERCAPLSGVFRVRRGTAGVRFVELSDAARVAVVRESVQSGGGSVDEELARLDSVRRLAAEARVGVLETRLGETLDATLRAGILDA